MSHPAQQIRFCTSRDGTRVAYAICGSGPPLVFAAHWVHHLKSDWDSPIWRHWLCMLTRRHTLIRYDLRGCGLSDREGVEFSFEKLVEDFEAVINAAGLERFAFIGMAVGAAIGMAYAVRHPQRIGQLVLYGAYVRNRLALNPTREEVEAVQAEIKVIERGWQNENPAYRQFFTSLHIPDATDEQMRAYGDLLRLTTSPANAVGLRRMFSRLDLYDIIRRVRCPTLVLQLRDDSVIPFDEGRAVAALIPGARFVPLDTRNFIMLEQDPEWGRLVAELDDFLPTPLIMPAGDELFSAADLTAREREVLELIAQGLDNGTIGSRLGISQRTARNYVSLILGKLGVNSRAQAIVRARDAGFGQKPSR
jgi:pimeloyl-ACP methyl ester carboxylesterase/DNA-binding CsgD family transcriptional regulator